MTSRRLHFITVRAFDEGIAALDKVLREIAQRQAGCSEMMTTDPRATDDEVAARGQFIEAARNALDGMRRAVTRLPATGA